jgi:hypothetical protein
MYHFRFLTGSLIALWLALPAGRADATAVFADTVLVKGPEYLTVLQLPIDAVGTYKVTATDLKWLGVPLQALSFGVFAATDSLGSLRGPGTFEFYKASSDKVFLQIYAQTTAPKYAGLVSILVETSAPPVPLPSSAVLLMSALGCGLLLRRPRLRRPYVKFA